MNADAHSEDLLRLEARGAVLAPVERLTEVLFGLITVLTFTCTLGVVNPGAGEVRAALVGALGCNLAWGVIDGAMYLLTQLVQRGRTLALARAVRASSDPDLARAALAAALPEGLARLLGPEGLEGLRRRVLTLPELTASVRLTRADFLAALGVFALVFSSTLPVALPFLFVSPLPQAVRVSNCVAIVLLYAAGHLLGRHGGLSAWRTGLGMVAIGAGLVLVALLLGG